MAFVENNHYYLEELKGSDFEIVKDEPNIIGWDVKTEEGILIGEVHNLLFDRQSRNVRYIVLDMDGNKLHLDTGRKVLIPIGVADLFWKDEEKEKRERREGDHPYYPDEDGDVVILPGVTIDHLNALPLYEKDHLSKHIETAIRNIFTRKTTTRTVKEEEAERDEFYKHEHFNDSKFYNRKKSKAK